MLKQQFAGDPVADDVVVVPKQKLGGVNVNRRNPRLRTSKYTIDEFSELSSFRYLWEGIQELPWEFSCPRRNGLYLQPKVYSGLLRSGPAYAINWIREHHISLTEKGMTVLAAIVFYQEFITYDELAKYHSSHHWGEMKADQHTTDQQPTEPKQSTLDDHPKTTPQEEKRTGLVAYPRMGQRLDREVLSRMSEKDLKDFHREATSRLHEIEDVLSEKLSPLRVIKRSVDKRDEEYLRSPERLNAIARALEESRTTKTKPHHSLFVVSSKK